MPRHGYLPDLDFNCCPACATRFFVYDARRSSNQTALTSASVALIVEFYVPRGSCSFYVGEGTLFCWLRQFGAWVSAALCQGEHENIMTFEALGHKSQNDEIL